MKKVKLMGSDMTRYRLDTLYESIGKQTKLIEGVMLQGNELEAHTHPAGEDCALVLSGELTYYVSSRETIPVHPGEATFGWQNVLHGYRNEEAEPVHLVIFSTPERTGLEYPSDDHPAVRTFPNSERKLAPTQDKIATSEFSTFQFITVNGNYYEELPAGQIALVLDQAEKTAYIFDCEPIHLDFQEEKRLLKYTAKS